MINRLHSLLALLSVAGCYGYYDHGTNGGGPSVYQGSPRVGSVCDVNASVDQCSSAGLACTPTLVDGGFICQLPGEFYGCDDSVGCASGLACQGGFCLQACTTTADCTDPLTVCAQYGSAGNQCLLNQCEGQEAFGLWQACSAASQDGSDGTCVPLDANAGPSGCQQAGAVALGGACQFDRADGGPGFCAVGLICMVDSAGDNRGICLSVCDGFGGGGPTCASGTSCVVTTLPLPPPAVSAVEYYSDTGACAQSCVPSASDGGTDPGGTDAGMADAGMADAGMADAGMADAGMDGGTDDGGTDAGTDAGAGGAVDGGCPAPTTCVNGSITSTPDDVCLP